MSKFNYKRFIAINNELKNASFKKKQDLLFELEIMNPVFSLSFSILMFIISLVCIGMFLLLKTKLELFCVIMYILIALLLFMSFKGFSNYKTFKKRYKNKYDEIIKDLNLEIKTKTEKAINILLNEKEDAINAFKFRLDCTVMDKDIIEFYLKKYRDFLNYLIKKEEQET